MIEIFKNVLRQESQAIADQVNDLSSDSVESVIQLILKARTLSPIIFMGVGKSGDIAKKISATFTSTGTPALFIHPSDALHGDLGLIPSQSVVICLSHSGETEELIHLLPFLKQRQATIISFTSQNQSTLARFSTQTLTYRIVSEACPLNLAPTTSTTVMLALGDALALSIMSAKKITAQDFALNHPSGQLGRRLKLTVHDVYLSIHGTIHGATHGTTNASTTRAARQECIDETSSMSQAIEVMTKSGLGAVAIVKSGTQQLVGILTDGDLRRALIQYQQLAVSDFTKIAVSDCMTRSPRVVQESQLAYQVLLEMEKGDRQISVAPLVDDSGHFKGLIRLHDLIRAGI
jgi:arabinose-5-phosphate isomerase